MQRKDGGRYIRKEINHLIDTQNATMLDELLSSLPDDILQFEINNYADNKTPLQYAIRQYIDKKQVEGFKSRHATIIKVLLKYGANPILYFQGRHSDSTSLDNFFCWFNCAADRATSNQRKMVDQVIRGEISIDGLPINVSDLFANYETITALITSAALISKKEQHEFIVNKEYPLLHYLFMNLKIIWFTEAQLTRIFTIAVNQDFNLNTSYKINMQFGWLTNTLDQFGLAKINEYLIKHDYLDALAVLLTSALNAGMFIDPESFKIAELYRDKYPNLNNALNAREKAAMIYNERANRSSRFSELPLDVLGLISNFSSAFFYDKKCAADKIARLAEAPKFDTTSLKQL